MSIEFTAKDKQFISQLKCFVNKYWQLGLCIVFMGCLFVSLSSKSPDRYPTIMTRRYHYTPGAFDLAGKHFDWAKFESPIHCNIAAKHLNAAKDSGQFPDDFGIGAYTFECP